MFRPFLPAVMCLIVFTGNFAAAEDLPAEAQNLIDQHQKSIADIERKAAEQTKAANDKLQADLEKLKIAYTKDGKLDEAVAIRDFLRAGATTTPIKTMPDPGVLSTYRSEVGRVMYFEVVGTTNYSIWGTDIYSHDSNLSTAAVHAGVLKAGEAGTVKVTILKDVGDFKASGRNGVSSGSWNSVNYEGYRVEAVKATKGAMSAEVSVGAQGLKPSTKILEGGYDVDAVKGAIKKIYGVKDAVDQTGKEALKK